MRKFGGLFFVVMLGLAGIPLVGPSIARADNGTGTVEDAARAIAAARDRANAAADAWAAAESKLDVLADDKAKLDAEVVALQAKVDALRKAVEMVAVNRYIGASGTGISLLIGNLGPTEQAQTAVLVGIINEASSSSLDDYADVSNLLDQKKARADKAASDYKAAQTEFAAKQQAALDEVDRLKVVEKERLTSAAVQKALDAQRQQDAEKLAQLAAAQLKVDQAAVLSAGSDGGDEGQGVKTGNSASGGSAGGTTGSGGSGGRPGAAAGQVYGSGLDWVCPIQGITGFADTWGEPRSGGRKHEGVDMISPRGTTIVAVVDGFAKPQQNELGGTTIWFTGADGNKYYYAHLDAYANLGDVVKGEIIGYVGDTGNARFSTPHLHFEIHPGGGPAVDPYPTVLANC
ncbi:MAG: peptidoglycan DD-metalloendopeptidase family protein [Actinobacteria bacterium]|nr:peptidoglycan DD-metalloendopeptidase family protein [Actinomycetota bacterium]